jgi:hypothetical protein
MNWSNSDMLRDASGDHEVESAQSFGGAVRASFAYLNCIRSGEQ